MSLSKSTGFSKEYDSAAIEGVAELTDSQINSILNSSSIRLNKKLTYVVPRQWVHKYRLARPVNGNEFAKKVFVLGINDDNEIASVVTLSMSGLRARHYGKVALDPTFMVEAVQNENGLWGAAAGVTQKSVFVDGSLPLGTQDKKGYIKRPFAFRVVDRGDCFTIKGMDQTDKGWSMKTVEKDGKHYLDLQVQTLNEYTEVDDVPEITDALLNEVAADFIEYTKDVPA